jgi:hypothetical protein
MALDYFQMISDLGNNAYKVKLSFNGPPSEPTTNLPYVPLGKHYLVENVLPGVNKTFLLETVRDSHVSDYEADEAVTIKEGNLLQLRGGGIIKTTNYPPPHNKVRLTYENDAALAWVYLSELTISSDSGNYLLSGKVKKISGQANFSLVPNVRLVTGKQNRTSEVLEIRVGPGSNSEQDFSGISLNNGDHGSDEPCSVIIHTANQLDFSKDYKKSGWFFMVD